MHRHLSTRLGLIIRHSFMLLICTMKERSFISGLLIRNAKVLSLRLKENDEFII